MQQYQTWPAAQSVPGVHCGRLPVYYQYDLTGDPKVLNRDCNAHRPTIGRSVQVMSANFSSADIVAVTKSAISQMIGKGYMDEADGEFTELDDHLIVDLGEKLQLTEDGDFAPNTAPDIMYKALLSQCGKIVIDKRTYVAKLPRLFVDTVDWGLFSEHVMIDLSDVMVDEVWNSAGYIPYSDVGGPAEGSRIASIEFGYYKPVVSAKLFKKAHGVMVPLTRGYDQMFTAFKGLAEYTEFVTGLFNSVENTLQAKAEVYAFMCVSMGIAKTFANGNAYDLRTEYAAAGGVTTGLTAEQLLDTADFQRFMLQRIAETKEYMQRMSALFNDGSFVTFSSEPRVIMLTKAAMCAKFGVRANTFNEQLLGIGEYDMAPAWQAAIASGAATPYNFSTASSISLTHDAADEAGLNPDPDEGAELNGVVAVIYDRYAMGVTLDKRQVASQFSASRLTTNLFYHALVRYQINDSYPIVSFYISEES